MSTFLSGQPATETNSQQSTSQEPTENKPFFQAGERVFKTQEDLARHIESAQEHIKKLESDFGTATELVDKQEQMLAKAKRVEELLDAYEQNSSRGAEDTTSLKKEEVIAEALRAFEQQQTQRTVLETQAQNQKLIEDNLVKHYGDRAMEVTQRVAAENGLSMEEVTEMSRRHPKVLLKMFDLSIKTDAKPTRSSVNSAALPHTPATGPRKSLMQMSGKERAAYVQAKLRELN